MLCRGKSIDSTEGKSIMSNESLIGLTELECAIKKHATFIVLNEHRTFSFLDFLNFKVDGREYSMTHGTFRNKISKLRDMKIFELAYNSGIAFYTLTGIKITRKLMTPSHIGIHHQQLLQRIRRVPNIKKHPLYKLIKHHPFNEAAIHDIHLKFTVVGLWPILSKGTDANNSVKSINSSSLTNNNVNVNRNSETLCILETDPHSKDIRLERRVINDLDVQLTVHHTDTVTVVIGCSCAPIIVDECGVIRLSEALATIEEELSQLVDQCNDSNHIYNSVEDVSYSKVHVPNHMSWIVTRWDFGVDGLITYTGPQFFFRWDPPRMY